MFASLFACFLLIALTAASTSDKYKCANSTICDSLCMEVVKKFEKDYSHGWAVRHNSIGQFFKKFECKTVVEIGIARGELSHYLLTHAPMIDNYNAVDPFIGGYDDANDSMSVELKQANLSTTWAHAILHKMRDFGCRFKLHHGMSDQMVSHFLPNSVDCIFIDGDHRYEAVRQDIQIWEPIVKPGGVFFFDDYSWNFKGVIKAVDEFVDNNHLEFQKVNRHNNYFVMKPVDRPLNMTFWNV